jgi:hypothetical protein
MLLEAAKLVLNDAEPVRLHGSCARWLSGRSDRLDARPNRLKISKALECISCRVDPNRVAPAFCRPLVGGLDGRCCRGG